MEGISDISIIGIDTTRPPIIRKEPYIDIFFQLSHQAPADWCKELNSLLLLKTLTKNTKISEKEGLFIQTWVREPIEIIALLQQLKKTVTECSRLYIERIWISENRTHNSDKPTEDISVEQSKLNTIVSSLVFD